MEKEKFLNLVKDAYQNAVNLRDKSKQKMEYLEQVNQINIVSEEYRKAQSEYKLACLNIERLGTLVNLPAYEKISAFSNDKIEEYRRGRINNANSNMKALQADVFVHEKEIEELKIKQDENMSKYSSELDNEKKEQILNDGKDIQKSITLLEENISEIKQKIEKLKSYISNLKQMSIEEIKEQIKEEKGLNNVVYEDYKRNDNIIEPIVNDKTKIRELLSLLYSYNNGLKSVNGYTIELSPYVVNVLKFLNSEKEIIKDNKLHVADYNDIYKVNNAIPSRLKSIQVDSKRIDKNNKEFFTKATLIGDNLEKSKGVSIEVFCDSINNIIKEFPELSAIVIRDLEELKSYNNFFTKTFQQSKVRQLEYDIQKKAYEWFANTINSYLSILKTKLKFIGYSNERFIMYLEECIERLSKVNGNLVIQNVLEEMPKIQNEYTFLIEKLTALCNDIEEKNKPLSVSLDKQKIQLEEINREINDLIGEKLSSSEIERLIRLYGNAPLEQSMSNIEISKLMDDIHRAAYSQNMSVEELTDYSLENENGSKSL